MAAAAETTEQVDRPGPRKRGPKPKGLGPRFEARFEADVDRRLNAAARQLGVKRIALVRAAVAEHLAKLEEEALPST